MAEKETVRRGYDELAETHAAERFDDDDGKEILTAFLDSLPASAAVLDAGCGQGTPVLARLAGRGPATGIDFSREQLGLAAENAPAAALTQGDMTALPFEDGAFDAVVAFWSLIHVPLESHQAVIEEFARVLRPGGRVLVCEGTNEWVGENPDWLDSGVRMEWEIAGAAATREQLETVGFTVVDSWGTPSSLAADRENEAAEASPWTFFAARLEE